MPCERCGWMPDHCTCQPATPGTEARVLARHKAAVRRAKRRNAKTAQIATLIDAGAWLTSPRWTVAHQFTPDGRSRCGLVHARPDTEPAHTTRRCHACEHGTGMHATGRAAA